MFPKVLWLDLKIWLKKINRHKMEAIVETHFIGSVRELKIWLEIVGKR